MGLRNVKIFLASRKDLDDCYLSLKDSKLFDEYFGLEKGKNFILQGINKQEVYIYIDEENKNIVGFMRIDEIGMFSKYPFLRLISVKKEYRNKGYGAEMLKHFEYKYKNKVDRIFLCVSSFNDSAKKLYNKLGFVEIGKIDGLYKKGVVEYILMKSI